MDVFDDSKARSPSIRAQELKVEERLPAPNCCPPEHEAQENPPDGENHQELSSTDRSQQ